MSYLEHPNRSRSQAQLQGRQLSEALQTLPWQRCECVSECVSVCTGGSGCGCVCGVPSAGRERRALDHAQRPGKEGSGTHSTTGRGGSRSLQGQAPKGLSLSSVSSDT